MTEFSHKPSTGVIIDPKGRAWLVDIMSLEVSQESGQVTRFRAEGTVQGRWESPHGEVDPEFAETRRITNGNRSSAGE